MKLLPPDRPAIIKDWFFFFKPLFKLCQSAIIFVSIGRRSGAGTRTHSVHSVRWFGTSGPSELRDYEPDSFTQVTVTKLPPLPTCIRISFPPFLFFFFFLAITREIFSLFTRFICIYEKKKLK